MSGSITKIIPALIRAKAGFAPAIKTKRNDHFKSSYVPLDAVIDAVEGSLLEQELVVVQTSEVLNGANVLRTDLVHVSGESISSFYLLKPAKEDPQGYGSAMTYARRYCLMALLGIAPEDDDGNYGSGVIPAKKLSFREPKQQAEENADRVAAGQEPVHSDVEKQAAIDAYLRYKKVDPKNAALIKSNWGTDYKSMKDALDKAWAISLVPTGSSQGGAT